MAEKITLLSFCFIAYTLVGYPLLVFLGSRLQPAIRNGARTTGDSSNSVSLIISVRNEAAQIAEKLENSLALKHEGISEFEIIVVSDNSSDETEKIVDGFSARGVRLLSHQGPGGKEAAQAVGIAAARGEILIFTDAKVRLPETALSDFVRYFADATVGAVSSTDNVQSGALSGEGAYVRYEMWLRAAESRFCSLVGLSGSCFAVRRALCNEWPSGMPSDFYAALLCRRAGLRAVLAPEICCDYKAVQAGRDEFSRKVRTVLRGLSVLRRFSDLLNPLRHTWFALQLWSHKLLRWLMPLFVLGLAYGLYQLALSSPLYALTYALGVVALLCGLIGALYPPARGVRVVRYAHFFLLTQVAGFWALLQFLAGREVASWAPSKKG